MSPSCRWGVPKGCSAKTSSCTPTHTLTGYSCYILTSSGKWFLP